MKLVIVLYGLCRQDRFVDVSGHELGDVIPEEDFSFVLIVEDADVGNFDYGLVQKSSNSRAWCSRGIVSKICRCGRCWPFRPKSSRKIGESCLLSGGVCMFGGYQLVVWQKVLV